MGIESQEDGVRVPNFLAEALLVAPPAVSVLAGPLFFAVKDNSSVCGMSVTPNKVSLGPAAQF
jgi:hypothetical protein